MMMEQEKDIALRETLSSRTPHNTTTSSGQHDFGRRGWTIIVFQALMFWVAAGAVTHGLNVILPTLSQTYGLNYSTLLALATPASWASIPAGPLCAYLCEKKGARFNIIFCLIACGICFGLLGYSSSLIVFVLLFAGVCFFGTGFAYVGGTSIIAHWFVRKQGLALGWCTVGQTASSAFFVPTMAVLFTWFGVQHGFWGISAIMFAMAILVWLFIANRPEDVGLAPDNEPLTPELKAAHQQDPQHANVCPISIKQLLNTPDVWFMGIATGGIYIMLVGVVSQIVPRMMEMGYDLSTAISYMSLAALFGTFGAYGWGWLNHKVGVKHALLIYTVWWMVSIVLNLFSSHALVLWASLLMIGFSLPGATNLSTAIIATKFPRHAYVRAIGIVHPIQSIVRCFAFSILALGISYLGGYTGAYLLLIAVGLVVLLLIWRIDVTPVIANDTSAATMKRT